MYHYNAKVLEVLDGDTIKLLIDLGFKIQYEITVRLNGINCAEKNTELGRKTKEFVQNLLPVDLSIEVVTYKPEKYGRMLADVILADKQTLNKILVDKNLAAPYDGKDKKENHIPKEQ